MPDRQRTRSLAIVSSKAKDDQFAQFPPAHINYIKEEKHPLCTDHHPAEGDAFFMITAALTSYLYKKR